jgi:hypothetical protein
MIIFGDCLYPVSFVIPVVQDITDIKGEQGFVQHTVGNKSSARCCQRICFLKMEISHASGKIFKFSLGFNCSHCSSFVQKAIN